jgi:soluble P-type ATPase
MLRIDIPGYKTFRLEHLVLDYNGTLALDGEIIDGVKERLVLLSRDMQVHVLTADTFGHARSRLKDVECQFHLIGKGDQALAKAEYVKGIGPERVVSMGNGRIDRLMLEISALGIGLIQEEGGAVSTLISADVICRDILDALDLLLFPLRLMATLRS